MARKNKFLEIDSEVDKVLAKLRSNKQKY